METSDDPITIGLIVAGGVLTAKGQIEQGRAARQAGADAQAIANRNALLAERQAEAEQQAAVATARKQEREGKALKSRQRAVIAKSGVLSLGSPLAVLVETAENLEADRLQILREGTISASQKRGEAGIFRLEGAAAKKKGKATSRASKLAAAGTILTTAGAGYSKAGGTKGIKAYFKKA